MQSVNKQQISVQLPLSTINKIESLKKLDDGKISRNKIIIYFLLLANSKSAHVFIA